VKSVAAADFTAADFTAAANFTGPVKSRWSGLKCDHEYNAMIEHLQRKILAVQDGNNSRGSRPCAFSLEQGRAQLKRAAGQREGETRQEPEPEPQ
jgi:hypothetical protein